ncbi:MAG TPA: hypothetical protein DEB06_07025 [Phycisphaerales bacterium]|nr:hypothetical protein [Phycisphaerales bacterium]
MIVLTCLVALGAAALTFFTGFGLGTLLLPAFALVLPVEAAVAATAVVHLANNLFKLALVFRDVDRGVLLRFALPAAGAALVGAGVLAVMTAWPALFQYEFLGATRRVSPVGLVVGVVIALFAAIELSPRYDTLAFPRQWIPLGGIVSGLFGGLSGHQGALRTAFLVRAGLTKERFIATGVASAVVVDLSRLAVYGVSFFARDWALLRERGAVGAVIGACLCALAGSVLGSRLVRRVTLAGLRRFIGFCLLLLAPALALGLI